MSGGAFARGYPLRPGGPALAVRAVTGAEPGAWRLAGLAVVMMTVMPAAAQPSESVEAAAAEESEPSVEAEADSVGSANEPQSARVVRPSGPVEPAAADTGLQAGGRLSPRAVLVRSAVVPGWGQAAGGHWVKALLFAGAGAGWLTSAVVESSRVADAPTPQEHADRAARRNTRVLLYLVTATLSAVDAYVDAHLEDFDFDAGNLETPGVRLTIRWGQ